MYGIPRRRGAQNFILASGAPVTMTLIAVNVVSFFTGAILQDGNPFRWLVFDSRAWPLLFWTPVTWPLVSPMEPINLLFGGFWAYWVAGSLERSWGTRPFLAFLAAMSALTALTLWVGAQLLQAPVLALGLWLAMAAPTVAWCVLNPGETILFSFLLPIRASWLAWLTVVLTWFEMGPRRGDPVLGLFALSGCAAAYWYARHGRHAFRGYARTGARPVGGGGSRAGGEPPLRFRDFDRDPPTRGGWSLKRWLDDRKQRRELEKLLRRSGFSDPDENKRR